MAALWENEWENFCLANGYEQVLIHGDFITVSHHVDLT